MTKKTKLQLPSMRPKKDDDTSIFSNKMWTQSYDELMKNIEYVYKLLTLTSFALSQTSMKTLILSRVHTMIQVQNISGMRHQTHVFWSLQATQKASQTSLR